MAIKTSGEISFAEIQQEFGGSGPISLNEYYRGSGLVAANTASSPSAFTQVLLGKFYDVQIPTSGEIQMSQFYGQAATIPGPAPQLLTNTGDATAEWISPVTGSIIVTLVGSGGRSGAKGTLWGGNADSTGGSGGGGAGDIQFRQLISVVKGTSYTYQVKPVTFIDEEVPTNDGLDTMTVSTPVAPRTSMFNITPANGGPGGKPQDFDGGYGGGTGGIAGGLNSGNGGNGGRSNINNTGAAGANGVAGPLAAGGAAGAAGQPGQPGYGYGAGEGGLVGRPGSDNDVPGGGGGGGGGFIPNGNSSATSLIAPSASGGGGSSSAWAGAIGCIYIEYLDSYPA